MQKAFKTLGSLHGHSTVGFIVVVLFSFPNPQLLLGTEACFHRTIHQTCRILLLNTKAHRGAHPFLREKHGEGRHACHFTIESTYLFLRKSCEDTTPAAGTATPAAGLCACPRWPPDVPSAPALERGARPGASPPCRHRAPTPSGRARSPFSAPLLKTAPWLLS